jgi:hypothetical protein
MKLTPLFLDDPCVENVLVALGVEACGKFKGLPKGFIFAGIDHSINVAIDGITNRSDIVDLLKAQVCFDTTAGTRAPKSPLLFPTYPNIVNFEPSGGEPNIKQEGFGSGIPSGITPYVEKYIIVDGGECLYKQLLQLEEREIRVFKVDENDTMYGALTKKGLIRGYKCSVTVTPRENTGAQSAAIILQINYANTFKKERDMEISVGIEDELDVLRELSLVVVSKADATARIVASCGGRSITKNNAALAALFVANVGLFMVNDVAYDSTLTYDAETDLFSFVGFAENGFVSPVTLNPNLFSGAGVDIPSFKGFIGNAVPSLMF